MSADPTPDAREAALREAVERARMNHDRAYAEGAGGVSMLFATDGLLTAHAALVRYQTRKADVAMVEADLAGCNCSRDSCRTKREIIVALTHALEATHD